MSTAQRIKRYTFADFCRLVKEDQKADLIDGVIYMASPENTDANQVMKWFGGLMDLYAEEKDLGQVFLSRVAFKIDVTNGPEPDIGFVRKKNRHRVKRGKVHGPPDLAVEIVSHESEERDYLQKRAQYERAGVMEYWIVDEEKEGVILLRLDRKGKYRQVPPSDGKLHSRVLTGFWIRPEWLWPATRSKKLDALNEILASEKRSFP